MKNLKDNYVIKLYLHNYKHFLFFLLISAILANIIRTIYQLIIKVIVDDVILMGDYDILIKLLAFYVALNIFYNIINITNQLVNSASTQLLVYEFQKRTFIHLQKHSLSYFIHSNMGELISNFNKDIDNISFFLSGKLLMIINAVMTLVVLSIALILLNYKLAIAFLLTLPIYYLSIKLVKKPMSKLMNKNRELWAKEINFIQDAFSNVKVTKLFNSYRSVLKIYIKLKGQTIKNQIKTVFFTNALQQSTNIISLLGIVIIIGYGAILIKNSELTIGGLVVFYTFTPNFLGAIRDLTNCSVYYKDFQIASKRINDIFKIEIENHHTNLFKTRFSNGKIYFNGINFGYEGTQLLKEVTFTINPGEKVALVGKNGSGKTTLINILLGLYKPNKGEITIDDISIFDVSINYLRKYISFVTQDVGFFNMSIQENFEIAKRGCTQIEIEEVCKKVGAHDFIIKLPNGYKTVIGQRGMNLSGGQLKKLAIARALIKNSRIIIFDEATAALDVESSMTFYELFNRELRDCTVIFIVHEFENLIYANRILLLDDGKIIESQNKELLMNYFQA